MEKLIEALPMVIGIAIIGFMAYILYMFIYATLKHFIYEIKNTKKGEFVQP